MHSASHNGKKENKEEYAQSRLKKSPLFHILTLSAFSNVLTENLMEKGRRSNVEEDQTEAEGSCH